MLTSKRHFLEITTVFKRWMYTNLFKIGVSVQELSVGTFYFFAQDYHYFGRPGNSLSDLSGKKALFSLEGPLKRGYPSQVSHPKWTTKCMARKY